MKPEIEIVDGQPLTSSKNVAEVFGKEHKHVMEAIRKLDCSEEFNRSNFRLVDYKDSKGESRPMYLMTFDGFTFLAMGFTGQKAAHFKEEYIKEFNRMRQQQVAAITVTLLNLKKVMFRPNKPLPLYWPLLGRWNVTKHHANS